MSSLLWIISFLLHMIAIAAIYKLLQQVQQLKNQSISNANIEKRLQLYIEEIKEENQKLQEYLQASPPDVTNKSSEMKKEIDESRLDKPLAEDIPTPTKEDEIFLPETSGEDTVEASLEAKVLQLHHQGNSVEQIASQLKCGKTEAEIIIKLSQQRRNDSV